MHRGYETTPPVRHENRHAISDVNGNRASWIGRDNRVGGLIGPLSLGRHPGGRRHQANRSPMDLSHAHQAFCGNSKRHGQPPAVVLGPIVPKGQIARRKSVRRKLSQLG